MASNLLTAALIGGGVGLGLLLLQRRAAAQTPPPSSGSSCDAVAAAAEKLGVPAAAAKTACELGLGSTVEALVRWWKGKDSAAIDGTNKSLNGEVELELGGMARRTACVPRSPSDPQFNRRYLRGTVLRFQNGCVPFEGAPGWEKCAPGTLSNHGEGGGCGDPRVQRGHLQPDGSWKITGASDGRGTPLDVSQMFTGGLGDPTTVGPFTADGERTLSSDDDFKSFPFPLPIPAGSAGWYVAGRPIVCASTTEPSIVRNHVTGTISAICGGGSVPPPMPGTEPPVHDTVPGLADCASPDPARNNGFLADGCTQTCRRPRAAAGEQAGTLIPCTKGIPTGGGGGGGTWTWNTGGGTTGGTWK